MLQRVDIVTSEQKKLKHHFHEFAAHSVRQRPSSVEDAIAIRSPSETTQFRYDARRRRKIEVEKLRKKEEKQKGKDNHLAEKSKKMVEKSVPHIKSK